MADQPAHKRILLKLSGEALMGEDSYGINRATIERIISEIADVVALGVEVAVVIGGLLALVMVLRPAGLIRSADVTRLKTILRGIGRAVRRGDKSIPAPRDVP